MQNDNAWLLNYKHNVFSQGGEDGVLEKTLDLLPETDGWCVEFGALDGHYLSNTCHLISSSGYCATLIEADKKHFESLRCRYSANKSVTTINAFVGFNKNDSLDVFLKNTATPHNFDLLSIDIDGNDYHVWNAIQDYEPKVVIIEFNPTIPAGVDYVQEADTSVQRGSSLESLVRLGKHKGYALVSVLGVNAVFVKAEYFPIFGIVNNRPDELRRDFSKVTHLFVGYDGEIVLVGSRSLPWHRLPIDSKKTQVLPAYLRKFPSSYNAFQKLIFAFYLLRQNPREFGAQFRKRLLRQ